MLRFSFALAAVLALTSLPARAQNADEDSVIDPVCQMNIKKSTAPFYKDFQGERFYFCNQSCLLQFEEFPDRFSSTVVNIRDGAYKVTWTCKKGKLHAKTDQMFILQVTPTGASPAFKPKSAEIQGELRADMGGGKTQNIPVKIALTPKTGPEKAFYFAGPATFGREGRVELVFNIVFDDGKNADGKFKAEVLAGAESDTGAEFEGKRMTMIIQHETMRKIGKFWSETEQALGEGKPGIEKAKAAFEKVKKYQGYIKDMVPHKPYEEQEDLAQFKALNEKFGQALKEMDAAFASGEVSKIVSTWKQVDALHCTKCHMKFRFQVFSDPESYPVVK